MTFTVWRCMQVYCRMSQTEFVLFLMVTCKVNRCLGRNHKGEVLLHLISSWEMNDPHMTSLVMLTSVLVKVLWVRFLHWKSRFFSFHMLSFKVLGCPASTQGEWGFSSTCWRGKYALFEIIRRICSPHLFIQSFIYIHMDLYSLFCYSDYSGFGHRELFHFVSHVPLICPVCFLSISYYCGKPG